VNVPFLYVYASDIILSPRIVNVPVTLADLGANAIVRYDPILRANSTVPTDVRVEVEQMTLPLSVTLRKKATDISIEGTAQRDLRPPADQERYAVTLNQSGWGVMTYNPLNPQTEHREVELVFQPQGRNNPLQSVPLDFRVDFYSTFLISVALSVASFVTFLAGLLGNIQKIRELLDKLTGANKQ
jgi:hypothetical protein